MKQINVDQKGGKMHSINIFFPCIYFMNDVIKQCRGFQRRWDHTLFYLFHLSVFLCLLETQIYQVLQEFSCDCDYSFNSYNISGKVYKVLEMIKKLKDVNIGDEKKDEFLGGILEL